MTSWKVAAFKDIAAVAERLQQRGMSVKSAEQKARLFRRAARRLLDAGVAADVAATAFYVPGRIEVLGKHTDYAGGRSLLVAVERGFCILATPREDAIVSIHDVAADRHVEFPFESELQPAAGDWTNYPQTVARRLARNFPGSMQGADVAFESDLPAAAGMSSSSALMVATYFVLATINQLDSRAEFQENICRVEDLAGYLGTVENGLTFGSLAGDRGVGTFGGSEDHTAILCARPQTMIQYAYCPVRFERAVALPPDHLLVVAVSGVVADKTGAAMGKYNRISQLAGAIGAMWRRESGTQDPHLAAAITSSVDAIDRLRQALQGAEGKEFSSAELIDRFEHFLVESEQIIPAVADRLDADSLARFGVLADRSQSLGARLLRNQTAETIWLAERARSFGAVAASAFGAGFGGSVWALVPTAAIKDFRMRWSREYAEAFPEAAPRAAFFATHAGPPACRLDVESVEQQTASRREA